MLIRNPVTSSSFYWFFCSWRVRTCGLRRKFKLRVHFLWAQTLTLLLGARLNPMPTALLSVPRRLLPQKTLFLWPKSLSFWQWWGYSFIPWSWSGATIKGDEGNEIHPSSRPQEQENLRPLSYTKQTILEERRWALFSFKPCALRNLLKRFYIPCEYTHFSLKTNVLGKPEAMSCKQ